MMSCWNNHHNGALIFRKPSKASEFNPKFRWIWWTSLLCMWHFYSLRSSISINKSESSYFSQRTVRLRAFIRTWRICMSDRARFTHGNRSLSAIRRWRIKCKQEISTLIMTGARPYKVEWSTCVMKTSCICFYRGRSSS